MDAQVTLPSLLQKLPSLATLIRESGDRSIFDYGQKHYCAAPLSDLWKIRQHECLTLVREYVETQFNSTLAEKVYTSLMTNYCVSTAEHHGPMGHPFFFQSAILRGLVNPEEAIVNFCTSHVSLGNSSYPRGIVFHPKGSNTPTRVWELSINEHTWISYFHLPFFSSKERMSPVFQLRGYTREILHISTSKKLQTYFQENLISRNEYERLTSFIENCVLSEEQLRCHTYSEQISRLNHAWWTSLFPSLPAYIPLDAEEIVIYLLQSHLTRHTFITQILTDVGMQNSIEEYFNGISCCFNLTKRTWTYLFWYLDDDQIRHPLWREHHELVTAQGFRMKLSPDDISYHLMKHHLIPSWLLVYTTLACYYGITCFGGFAQGNYLPKIQAAYRKLLLSMNIGNEEVLSSQPSLLNEDMVFVETTYGEITTALDLTLEWTPTQAVLLEKAQNTTLRSSIEKMIPEIARCL